MSDSSMVMGGCKVVNLITETIGKLFTELNLGKTINIFNIKEKSLQLDLSGKLELFGVKLESESNKFAKYDGFVSLVNQIKYQPESRIFLFCLKTEDFQAVYLFSFNEEAISQLASDFDIPQMSGNELVNALQDIYFMGDKEIVDNSLYNVSESTKSVYQIDHFYNNFARRISMASSAIFKNYHIYQGYEYNMAYEFNPIEFFKLKWNGLFGIMYNFNHKATSGIIKKRKEEAQVGDALTYQEIARLEKHENKSEKVFLEENCCVANSMLILDDKRLLAQMSGSLGISFDENYQTSSKIIPKTIMMSREGAYDAIIENEVAKKMFRSCHKRISKNAPNKRGGIPDFYGKDVTGNFVNHTLSDNNNAHSLIIGETGAGKSVGVLKILSCLTNLNLSLATASYLQDGHLNVRYCDVGHTGGRVIERLKSIAPNNVEVLPSSVNNFKFALFDYRKNSLGKVEKEDINFTVQFMNTMLEISSSKDDITFTNLEEEKLTAAINTIVDKNITTNYSLEELIEKGFGDIVEEMLSENSSYTLKTEISEITEEKYNYFKIPILSDLISYVKDTGKSNILSESVKKIYESLELKLESLNVFSCFNSYSNVDFKESKNLFYIDFNSIKNDQKLFTAIFWMLYRRWYDQDKINAQYYLDRGEMPIPSYYFIEEAHNFLNIPAFKKLFDVAVREARKFHIKFMFITQHISDIPTEIYNAIATKLIIFPESKKASIKQQIKESTAAVMEKDEEQVFDNITKHMSYMTHNDGCTGIKFNVTEEEVALYKPKKIA